MWKFQYFSSNQCEVSKIPKIKIFDSSKCQHTSICKRRENHLLMREIEKVFVHFDRIVVAWGFHEFWKCSRSSPFRLTVWKWGVSIHLNWLAEYLSVIIIPVSSEGRGYWHLKSGIPQDNRQVRSFTGNCQINISKIYTFKKS